MDWPPGLKALHFGMAFNPRPPAAAPAAAGPRSSSPPSSSSSGGGGGGGSSKGTAAAGRASWARFLAPTLEEIVFGGHFNQPVVRGERGDLGLRRGVALLGQRVGCSYSHVEEEEQREGGGGGRGGEREREREREREIVFLTVTYHTYLQGSHMHDL